MAKNKSYRKFIATGATAAMVATAVVPTALAASSFTDVNKNYKDAVDYLVENKIASGKSDKLFGTTESITRGDAAVMIANALGLDTAKAPDAGFKDLNSRVKGAVNALFAEGIINGKTKTEFAPAANITRAEMAKVVALAYELKGDGVTNKFKDVNSTFAPFVNALVKNEITLGKTATSFAATADVTRGEFALFVHRAEGSPAVGTVASVKVVDVNKVEVKFGGAVDTAKVTVALKKGLATQYTAAKWAEDKKSVVLEAPSTIPAGDYEVVVTGLGDKEIKKPIKVEAEVVKAINVTNQSVAKTDAATVTFEVLNQYGARSNIGDGAVSVSAYNVTQGKDYANPTATFNAADKEGKFTLNLSEAKLNDKIRVIVSFKGVTVSKELTVSALQAEAAIELGNAELLKDTTRFTVGEPKGIKLPYVLKDQYGKDLKLKKEANGFRAVTFLSSDNAIVDPKNFDLDADGNLIIKLGDKAGSVTITAIINASGSVSTTTLKVDAAAKVNNVGISAPTKLVAAGEKVELDLTATDQFGGLIKSDDAKVSKLTFTSSNHNVVDKDDAIKVVEGKLHVTTKGKGSVTITAINAGTEVGKVTFSVEDKAVATAITGVDVATLYENKATDTVEADNINVKDQYGRDFSLSNLNDVTVTHKDGTEDNVTAVKVGNIVTFTGTASTNNEVITFALKNGAKYDLTVASVATKDITTYSIKDLATIYKSNDAKYAATLQLVGKTSAGKEVALAAGKVTNSTVSNGNVEVTLQKVVGKAKGTSVVTLWSGATKLASTTVTVSDEAPYAKAVSFEKASYTVTNSAKLELLAELKVKDQYGVDFTTTGFWTSTDDSVATVDGGTVTKLKNGETTIGFVTSNGVVATTKVKFN